MGYETSDHFDEKPTWMMPGILIRIYFQFLWAFRGPTVISQASLALLLVEQSARSMFYTLTVVGFILRFWLSPPTWKLLCKLKEHELLNAFSFLKDFQGPFSDFKTT